MTKTSTATSLLSNNSYQKSKRNLSSDIEILEGIGNTSQSYNIKSENTVSSENDHQEYCSYRSVWRATITQAVIDATSKSSKTADIVERNAVLSWFSLNSSGFLTVCALADLNPEFVLERIKLAIKHPEKWKKYSKAKPLAKEHEKKLNQLLFETSNN